MWLTSQANELLGIFLFLPLVPQPPVLGFELHDWSTHMRASSGV